MENGKILTKLLFYNIKSIDKTLGICYYKLMKKQSKRKQNETKVQPFITSFRIGFDFSNLSRREKMLKNYKIRAPYFEIGPKCFMWGERMLKLAKTVDKIAMKYDLDVIITPQYADIRLLAENTERIHVYAQHMDSLVPGRGLGSVLPESVKEAGAVGVMLNHAEKKLTLDEIKATIARADEVGLATIVCADSVEEIRQVALLAPNLIVAEPTELIGTGVTSDMKYVVDTIEAVRKINPDIMVLQGAGISGPDDVANVIRAGAQATGCTSGVMKAADPEAAAEEMLYALRKTWDEVHGK